MKPDFKHDWEKIQGNYTLNYIVFATMLQNPFSNVLLNLKKVNSGFSPHEAMIETFYFIIYHQYQQLSSKMYPNNTK